MNSGQVLCVDLDGCLVRTDTLVESLFLFLRLYPLRAPMIVLWLFRGKAHLKSSLAAAAPLRAEALPYNPAVLSYIQGRRAEGIRVILATGADQRIAAGVATHLNLFDEVHASDGITNLTGRRKADHLSARYADFEYIGNSRADIPVWRRSRSAIVVSSSTRLLKKAGTTGSPARLIPRANQSQVSAWLRVLRVYQWVKNLLIFLPVMTAHRLTDIEALRSAGIAFLAWCCAASGTYLLNDLLDLSADRAHPRKRLRPFAAGELNLATGTVLALILYATGVALASLLSAESLLLLLAYAALTISYSVWLKQFPVIDVLLLVCFYLLRILAGGLATGISISIWLLAFSLFFFLSLALVKRLTELRAPGWETSTRGYQISDVQLLGSLAGSSAYLSVVLLALYINSPEVHLLYQKPQLLWPICLVIVYWLTRIILLANRGQLDDDPIVFATRDKASWFTVFAIGLFLYCAR